MTIPLLAKEFSRILQEWFIPALLKQAIARNETAEYKGACATHDFCDENLAMDEAFENLGSKGISDFETDSPEQVAAMDLWNTSARIEQDLRSSGLDRIAALRSVQIRSLVDSGFLQLSLFDHQDLAEISHPDYAGERLIACRNPLLAEKRFRKRQELLAATEKRLDQIVAATRRTIAPCEARKRLASPSASLWDDTKWESTFSSPLARPALPMSANLAGIAEEAALDGIYVLRTSAVQQLLSAEETVRNYKRLSIVERAFRSLKSVDLKLRPIHHHLANRVRAHVLLCMLAAYVEWLMKQALTPLLFTDEEPEAGEALRSSVVAPALRSPAALEKTQSHRTRDGLALHSFHSLLQDLATLTLNQVTAVGRPLQMISTPTPRL